MPGRGRWILGLGNLEKLAVDRTGNMDLGQKRLERGGKSDASRGTARLEQGKKTGGRNEARGMWAHIHGIKEREGGAQGGDTSVESTAPGVRRVISASSAPFIHTSPR